MTMTHTQEHTEECGGCVININCGGSKPPVPPIPCKNSTEYAEVYSTQAQTLSPSTGVNLPGQVCLLENTIITTANIDVSQAKTTGVITFNKSGWYDVATGICGALNPVPTPLPVWTLSLFKNGILVPGSTFANLTISPTQQANEIVADVYVHFNKGDKLTLNSTSTLPVFLSSPTLGTNARPSSAYMKISLLQEDANSGNPLVDAYNVAANAVLNAANISLVSANTVNTTQSPSNALIAQTNAVAVVTMITAAQTALTAATSVSTPASVTAATSALTNALSMANLAVTAANTVVSTLNPTNTALLVTATNNAQFASVAVAASPLVAL